MTDTEKMENKRKRLEAYKTDFTTWARHYFPEYFQKEEIHTVLISADLPDMFEKLHLVSVYALNHNHAGIAAKNWLLNDLIIQHPYLSELINIQSFEIVKSCLPMEDSIPPTIL